jgi:DNA-binding MarR family transcriptional regulator
VTATVPDLRVDDAAPETQARVVEEASLSLVEMTLAALSTQPTLSLLQLRLMLAIDRHGPLNLSALAERVDLSISSASRVVDRLVDGALVDRRPAEHSRRELTLSLTTKGRRALGKLRRPRVQSIARIIAAMDAHERSALVEGMSAFARATLHDAPRGWC